jgi:NADH dehydrogenase
VVGGGFGGLAAAKALARAPVDVTLVDRQNFHTFQPLLYQVATAGLSGDDIAYSIRGIFHHQDNVGFELGTVCGVDFDARQLYLDEARSVPYDFLVLAAGTTTADFGIPGVAEHGLPLKTLPDALRVRNHVLRQFELVDRDRSLMDEGYLTFVVAGGGPTGVETAGALMELFDMVLRKDFPAVEMSRVRVVLVEAADYLLAPFHSSSREHAMETLQHRGVEVRVSTPIESVEPGAVHVGGGETILTRTLIWAAGVRANPLGAALGLEVTRAGRVVVDADLSVPAHPEIFVIGDLAAALGKDGEPLPQIAQPAIQGGHHVAHQIERRLDGRPSTPFRYRDKGTMATIGRHAAVAELPFGLRFWGFPAWLMWLFLHLLYLIGFRNRLNVLVNWWWNYVTYDRGARLIVEPVHDPG